MSLIFENVQQLQEELNRLKRIGYTLFNSWENILNNSQYQKARNQAPPSIQKKFYDWKSILALIKQAEKKVLPSTYYEISELARSEEISLEERINALRELLKHSNKEISNRALREFAEMDELPINEQIALCQKLLKKPDKDTHLFAIEKLGKIGPLAKNTVSEIIKKFKEEPQLQEVVEVALKNILVSENLKNDNVSVKIDLTSNQALFSETRMPLKAFHMYFNTIGIALCFLGFSIFDDYYNFKQSKDFIFFLPKEVFCYVLVGTCFLILGNCHRFYRNKVFFITTDDQGIKTVGLMSVLSLTVALTLFYMEEKTVNLRMLKFFIPLITLSLIPFFPKWMLIANIGIAVYIFSSFNIEGLRNGTILILITILFYKVVKKCQSSYKLV